MKYWVQCMVVWFLFSLLLNHHVMLIFKPESSLYPGTQSTCRKIWLTWWWACYIDAAVRSNIYVYRVVYWLSLILVLAVCERQWPPSFSLYSCSPYRSLISSSCPHLSLALPLLKVPFDHVLVSKLWSINHSFTCRKLGK